MWRVAVWIKLTLVLLQLVLTISSAEKGEIFQNAVRHETEVVIGFPDAVKFLTNYKNKPLLMRKVGLTELPLTDLPDDIIWELPHAFTVFVKPQNSNTKISLRQFLKTYADENLSLSQQIPLFLKSQIKLPRCLDCEILTDERLSNTELVIRKGSHVDELRSPDGLESSLICSLDGIADIILTDGTNISSEQIIKRTPDHLVSSFHRVSLKPGDCVHVPTNWLRKLSTKGRTVLISVVYDSTNLEINENACGKRRADMTLDGLSFKKETTENFFDVIALANLALFIENYVQKPNTTEGNFAGIFKKDEKLQDVKNWDEECEAITKELFIEMDIDRNKILSVSDFDSVDEERIMFLSGFLEDKMADFKDIIEDQLGETLPERRDVREMMANGMKSDYEKEMQRVLEEGFNEIFKEANIDGALSFSDNGKPNIRLSDKRKESDDRIEDLNPDEIEDIIVDAGTDGNLNQKEEL